MVITNSTFIPDDDQLTVEEVKLGTPALRAAAFHMGKYCENQNNTASLNLGETCTDFKWAWGYINNFCIIDEIAYAYDRYLVDKTEFMLCRQELDDPRPCLNEGKAVTACALEFFRKIKKTCYDEFSQYANCLDKTGGDMAFNRCRMTQAVYDKCVLDNLNLERPPFGYFCEVKVHDSPRPKPPAVPKVVYPDTPDRLPEDAERPPARFGTRYFFLN